LCGELCFEILARRGVRARIAVWKSVHFVCVGVGVEVGAKRNRWNFAGNSDNVHSNDVEKVAKWRLVSSWIADSARAIGDRQTKCNSWRQTDELDKIIQFVCLSHSSEGGVDDTISEPSGITRHSLA
jgi:hypothetical protein